MVFCIVYECGVFEQLPYKFMLKLHKCNISDIYPLMFELFKNDYRCLNVLVTNMALEYCYKNFLTNRNFGSCGYVTNLKSNL